MHNLCKGIYILFDHIFFHTTVKINVYIMFVMSPYRREKQVSYPKVDFVIVYCGAIYCEECLLRHKSERGGKIPALSCGSVNEALGVKSEPYVKYPLF